MKRKSIVNTLLILLTVLIAVAGFFVLKNGILGKRNNATRVAVHTEHIAGTETNIDSSLSNLLKPVNEQVVARIPIIKAENSTRIFSVPIQGSITYDTRNETSISSRIAGRIERMYIKYNFQPVRKGQLLLEIYSPDLAAAQRELLFINDIEGNSPMLQRARQRLLLLGMSQSQINGVLRSKRILYKVPVYSPATGYILEKQAISTSAPAGMSTNASSDLAGQSNMGGMGSSAPGNVSTSNTPALQSSPLLTREGQYLGAGQNIFTIYKNNSQVAEFAFEPSLASMIKKGQKLVLYKTSDPATVYTGTIGLIQPTFRQGSNFTLARVYTADNIFQIGQLVTANIPVVNRGWWLPQSAVITLGTRKIVFKKEGSVFVPKNVKSTVNREGMVLIIDDIKDWQVASNASYLVDSESFIKTDSEN